MKQQFSAQLLRGARHLEGEQRFVGYMRGETAHRAEIAEGGSPRPQGSEPADAIGEQPPATARHPDPVAVLTGVLSAALGLVALGLPASNPMAYSTTVNFVWLGLALVAMGWGRQVAAQLLVGVAGLIDLAILIVYLTGAGHPAWTQC